MLSLGIFPTSVRHDVFLHNPRFAAKSPFPVSVRFHLNGAVLGKLQNGLHLYCAAMKTKRKGETEMDGRDEPEDDMDGDDEVVIPLQNMKKWLENPPPGFGEGKVYDTSIEDKLMEEIEQSRKAQIANLNNLKDSSVKSLTKKETSKRVKGTPLVKNVVRVRITNLPKKKNVHRDLRLAFNGVHGILGITPVVSGNEKTRDPICKGLAFVDFKHLEDANRFMQNFSGASVSFGKVEKQIKCEIMKETLPKSASDETDVVPLDLWEETDPNKIDGADEMNGISTTSESNFKELERIRDESKQKKAEGRRRKDKVPKLRIIPGSAKRLKTREKSLLTGVFSKYGKNRAVKEQSG